VHSFDFRIQAPYTSLKETKSQTKLQSKREICEIQNQKEEQYKVIQNFQVPQKIQSDTNFQVLYLQKTRKETIQNDTKIFKCHKRNNRKCF
jgi:hypothetical protein